MIRAFTKRAIRRARAWVTSFRPSVVALLYHRVADDPFDPFGLCVSQERFADQLACLARRYPVLSVDELAHRLDEGLPKRAVVLTFDDGYADVWSRATPILKTHRLPAIAFVTAAALDDAAVFWWDDLTRSLSDAALPVTLRVQIGGAAVEWQLRDAAGRLDAYYDAHSRLRVVSPGERRAVLDDLRSQVDLEREAPLDRRAMTEAELRDLAASGWVRVGAHTMTHPLLPIQPVDVQRHEIADGRTRLEELLGTAVDSFAYPHGHFDDTTARLVRECGFRVAFAATPGIIWRDSDRYRLPRIAVRNCSGQTLCEHVDAWFSGRPRPWPA